MASLDMSLEDMMKAKPKKFSDAGKVGFKPKGQGRGAANGEGKGGEGGLKRKLDQSLDDVISKETKKGWTNGAEKGKGKRKGAGKGWKRKGGDDEVDEEADFTGPRRGVQQRKTWGFGAQFRAAQRARTFGKGGSGSWQPARGSRQGFNRVEESWAPRSRAASWSDDDGMPPRKRLAVGGPGNQVAWAVAKAAIKDAATDPSTRDFTKVSGGPRKDFRVQRQAMRAEAPPSFRAERGDARNTRGMRSGAWRDDDAPPPRGRRDYREPSHQFSGEKAAKRVKYSGHSFDVSESPPPRDRVGRGGGRMGRAASNSPPPAKTRQKSGIRSVRVAGIAPALSSRAVRDAFESSAGPVESFSLKSGIAWLTFTKPGDAVRAVEMFNQGQLNGRTIVVTLENTP